MSRSVRTAGAIPGALGRRSIPRRFPGFTLLFVAWSLFALGASAALGAARESFDYPVGTLTTQNGGTGFAGPWGGLSGSSIVTGSLSDPSGLLATSGNHIEEGDILAPSRKLAGTVGTPGTELWLSFLVRRDRDEVGWTGLSLHRFTSPGQGEGGSYFIGEPGSGAANGTWGVGAPADDTTFVSSGVPFRANETTLLVARVQFTAANDPITLFVNPTPGVEPTGGVTFTGTNFQPFLEPTLTLQGVNNGANPVAWAYDELRFGSTYAEVAPVVPEPSMAIAVPALAVFLTTRMLRRQRRG